MSRKSNRLLLLGAIASGALLVSGCATETAYRPATGTGFAVGTGRSGSVLAPIIAGLLFKAGYGLEFVAIAMGIGSFAAAIALWFLPFKSEPVSNAQEEAVS